MATHSSIPAGRIPRTEEPGGLQSMGHKDSDMTERLSTHTHIYLSFSYSFISNRIFFSQVICFWPFYMVHGVLMASILEWFAISPSSLFLGGLI